MDDDDDDDDVSFVTMHPFPFYLLGEKMKKGKKRFFSKKKTSSYFPKYETLLLVFLKGGV